MKLPARELAGLSLGIEMVLSVVLTAWVGRWADARLGTEPAMLIVGVVLGAAAGFRQMWRYMARMDREDAQDSAKRDDDAPPDSK